MASLPFASKSLQRLGAIGSVGALVRRAAPNVVVSPSRLVATRSISMYDFRQRSLPANTIIKFVPQQEAWIVERFGRFNRILQPGLNFLVPIVEQIKYVQSLKEVALEIPPQSAVTNDNVTLQLDGVLYFRIVDPYKASYGIENAEYALAQLAQTTMRSEIGKLVLDATFKERDRLNQAIVSSLESATATWGIECLRYEIRDIALPDDIVKAMQMQSSAERRKRATILDSEGTRQSEVNIAEGRRQATVLASEASMTEKINIAKGEAEAISVRALATAEAIAKVAEAIASNPQAQHAIALTVAEKYIEAFAKLAKETNTVLLPSSHSDPASFVAQAMTVVQSFNKSENLKNKSSF